MIKSLDVLQLSLCRLESRLSIHGISLGLVFWASPIRPVNEIPGPFLLNIRTEEEFALGPTDRIRAGTGPHRQNSPFSYLARGVCSPTVPTVGGSFSPATKKNLRSPSPSRSSERQLFVGNEENSALSPALSEQSEGSTI